MLLPKLNNEERIWHIDESGIPCVPDEIFASLLAIGKQEVWPSGRLRMVRYGRHGCVFIQKQTQLLDQDGGLLKRDEMPGIDYLDKL